MYASFRCRSLLWLLALLTMLFGSQARVLAAPPNDNYAAFVPLPSLQTGSIDGTNMLSSFESGEPYRFYGRTVWYKWMAPASGGITFTLTSDYNLFSRVYTGTVVNNLSAVSYNETGYGSPTHTFTFNAVAGTIYSIQIQDYNNSQGSFTLSWQPGPASNDNFAAAVPLSGPSVDVSGTNVLSSYESGEPYRFYGRTVWYRWQAPGSGGATFTVTSTNARLFSRIYTGNAVASLSAVSYNETGYGSPTHTFTFNAVAGTNYAIQIQDYNNETGTFNLFGGLAPGNDLFVNAQALTNTRFGRVTGLNFPASSEAGEPKHGGIAGGASVWYKWTAPVSSLVTFNTDGSDFNTLLGVYTGTGSNFSSLTTVGGDDNYDNGVNFAHTTINYSSAVQFYATQNTTYYIAVDGYNALTGHFTLSWTSIDMPLSFHGAPQGDIVFQNSSSGAVYYYLMNGVTKASEGFLWQNGDPNWKVVFTPDINGDGKPDVIFQHQQTGAVYYWLMNGINKTGEGLLWTGGDVNWKLVAYGDLDNDGRADIVFQNQLSGQVYYYLLNGGNKFSEGTLWQGGDAYWKLVGVADINFDGHLDLIFQNSVEQNGTLYYQLFNGVNKIGEGILWNGTNPNLNVVATADMNGDGKPDLILQNSQTGAVTCFVLNGLAVFSTNTIWSGGDATWKVTGVSEFNRDNKTDIVFQNSSSGAVYYYLMNGLLKTSDGFLWTGGDATWKLLLTPHN